MLRLEKAGALLLSLSDLVVRWGVGAPAPPVTSVEPLLLCEEDRGANVSFLCTGIRIGGWPVLVNSVGIVVS